MECKQNQWPDKASQGKEVNEELKKELVTADLNKAVAPGKYIAKHSTSAGTLAAWRSHKAAKDCQVENCGGGFSAAVLELKGCSLTIGSTYLHLGKGNGPMNLKKAKGNM